MKRVLLYGLTVATLLIVAAPNLVLGESKPAPSGKVVFAVTGENFAGAVGGDFGSVKWLQPWMPALAEPLFLKDKDAKIGPALAESWEISEDNLTITMKLRKGPTFHNGDPITAHDVKFSTERYAEESRRMVFGEELRQKLKSVDVIDDYTVAFHFNSIYNAFWDRFFEYFMILPKNYIQKVGDEEFAKNPVGSGPFKWVGYKQDVHVDLEAYEGHYRQVPDIKSLRTIYVKEDSTRLAMLRTGEADMITPGAAHLNEIDKDPGLRLVWANNTRTVGLAFGDLIREGNLPLKDKKVRMAVSYAIDRKAICDVVLQGACGPSNSFLAPWHAGYDPVKAEPTAFDPAKAKALLAEAGYANGFSTQINLLPQFNREMQAVAGYLAKVGINAKLNVLEAGAYTELCHAKKTEGIIWRDAWWNSRTHPTSPIDVQLTLKAPWSCGITNQRVSDAIEAVGMLGLNNPNLAAKAREMDDIILEEMPRICLWTQRTAIALGPRIEYYEPIEGFIIPTRTEFIRLKK